MSDSAYKIDKTQFIRPNNPRTLKSKDGTFRPAERPLYTNRVASLDSGRRRIIPRRELERLLEARGVTSVE